MVMGTKVVKLNSCGWFNWPHVVANTKSLRLLVSKLNLNFNSSEGGKFKIENVPYLAIFHRAQVLFID